MNFIFENKNSLLFIVSTYYFLNGSKSEILWSQVSIYEERIFDAVIN